MEYMTDGNYLYQDGKRTHCTTDIATELLKCSRSTVGLYVGYGWLTPIWEHGKYFYPLTQVHVVREKREDRAAWDGRYKDVKSDG